MRLTIVAVGRLRAGPEAALVADYLERVERTGRVLGIGPARVIEVEDRKGGGSPSEGRLLLAALPKGAPVVALDERGRDMTSPELAALVRRLADGGTREMAFVIGGADGLDPAVRSAAGHVLSFGCAVWPHMLVRAMLAEQLYRAVSILAGTPYHRGG